MEMVEEVQNQLRIAAERLKMLEIVEEEGGEVDRISVLPDCLLVEIVSRLDSTKEAIRTGTLSNRWKHIWTFAPVLIFTDLDCECPWPDFVSLVDKTLTQCRQLKLKKFIVLTIHYENGFESQVNNWIRYAIRCNVEEFNLLLRDMEFGDAFVLDQFFFINSCFTKMTLAYCMFNPTGAISWKSLRSLWIARVKLDEDLIENILSGSPQLETLQLDYCHGYRRLDITSKSLKNLVFSGYIDPKVEWHCNRIIEINAPNILSLTIKGELYLRELLLLNVSSLVEANLDYSNKGGEDEIALYEEEEEMLEKFISNLRHVKELKFGVFCSQVLSYMVAEGFVIPCNVKVHDAFIELLEEVDLSNSDSDSAEVDLSNNAFIELLEELLEEVDLSNSDSDSAESGD